MTRNLEKGNDPTFRRENLNYFGSTTGAKILMEGETPVACQKIRVLFEGLKGDFAISGLQASSVQISEGGGRKRVGDGCREGGVIDVNVGDFKFGGSSEEEGTPSERASSRVEKTTRG